MFLAGIEIISFVIFSANFVVFPVNNIVLMPLSYEYLRALITFLLFPEVDIPIATSPFFPIASICLEKIKSKPKSFPIAERDDVSVTKDNAEIGFLFFENLTVNSVERCCASAALPPLPKKIILFFF